MQNKYKQASLVLRGFTLVELSIVLVIIGLLVGGVLVGTDLISAARTRSIITEKDTISRAIYGFKLKYNSLPGDYSGTMTGAFAGNGNGVMDDMSTGGGVENWNAWLHLSASGMLWGQNLTLSTVTYAPASKFGNGVGYFFIPYEIQTIQIYGQNQLVNVITVGTDYSPPAGTAQGLFPLLSVDVVKSIDSKIDDGLPATGATIVMPPTGIGYWWGPVYNCASTSVAATAVYDTSVSTRTCLMVWKKMY